VLKKAGIVVATAAAGLLAVSPLAFAGNKGDAESRDSNGNRGDQTIVQQDGDGGNNACSAEGGDVSADENGNSGVLNVIPLLNGVNALNNVNALQCVNLLNDNNVQVTLLGDNEVEEND
jgi:hypothetical protein